MVEPLELNGDVKHRQLLDRLDVGHQESNGGVHGQTDIVAGLVGDGAGLHVVGAVQDGRDQSTRVLYTKPVLPVQDGEMQQCHGARLDYERHVGKLHPSLLTSLLKLFPKFD